LEHVERTVGRCKRVFEGIKANVIGDVAPGRIEACLANFRRNGLPTDGESDRKPKPLSMASSNYYLRAIRSFFRWLVSDRRIAENPVAGLKFSRITDADKRRRRRNLTDDEFAFLVTTATTCNSTLYGLSGPDRATLYLVAANTGLRASELASLTPTSFDLDSPTATVRCLGAYTKNGQEAVLPVRAELVTALAEWLQGRPAETPLWSGNWSQFNSAKIIRVDLDAGRDAWLEAAKTAEQRAERERSSFLKYADASGRYADFHSLRHTFISNLAKAGVHPKNAQALARHSSIELTMNVYTHTVLTDLAHDLEKLPPLPKAKEPQPAIEGLADTGTDGPSTDAVARQRDANSEEGVRRRTRRRNFSDPACGKRANDGDTWRNAPDAPQDRERAEDTGKSSVLAMPDGRCRELSCDGSNGASAPGSETVSVWGYLAGGLFGPAPWLCSAGSRRLPWSERKANPPF
jgi:integrase